MKNKSKKREEPQTMMGKWAKHLIENEGIVEEEDNNNENQKKYGIDLMAWSIQWGIVLAIPLAFVSYIIQFIIYGNITWAPLLWIGLIIGIGIIYFWLKEVASSTFFK